MPISRAVAAPLAICTALSAQRPLNLLFYGNSYSADNASVPAMVGVIADAAGQLPPRIVPRLAGGTTLNYHRTDPGQVAAITNSLPPGEFWDFVILQGSSTESTHLLNPVGFRADAVAIVQAVRAHSSQARAVLYQTWARAYGHNFYPAAFANPMAMHNELRANYQLAADDINQACGPGVARLARAGDAVAALACNPALYVSDLSHPTQPITLVASMTVYNALWQDTVCRLNPTFTQQTAIGRHFIGNGFTPQMWGDMRGYADLVSDRSLRRFPGSGDDLLLRAGATSNTSPCARIEVAAGSSLSLDLTTPNWVFSTIPSAILLDLIPPGPDPVFPELFVGQVSPVTLRIGTLNNRLNLTLTVPLGTPSHSLLVQGIALAPSSRTRNRLFSATDGIEIRTR